ncbi:MAG: methyltransferase domain-containing protein [Actinomycetota bacterium]|nr:methyltransferase domain-containing protein [Acidimicrobiia bacterium]MDQ3293868.1 methyltransferase domain-containing protein [Actinomycetota bacterium]
MDEHEQRRATSFGEDASAYDRARPSYPAGLLDELLAGRDPRATGVLDVGCGTAKAALLFLQRGCEVLGVEPDARMAEVARGHGVKVEVSPFETWDRAGRTFDLVTAAQAWHWVDQEAGARAAAAALVPGGRLAIFWNLLEHSPEAKAALSEVYAGYPELRHPIALGAARAEHRPNEGIDAAGAFGPQRITAYEWSVTHRRDEWLDQLPTHSDHRLLPPERLAALLAAVGDVIDGLGGSITLLYETVCWSAERVAS